MTRGIIAVYPERKKDMNDEYTYEEELKLSADRDFFDKCCISCAAEDAFNEIDMIQKEESERIVSENPTYATV